MSGLTEMELSEEERAVVLAMRHSERGGRAIFNYALRFDSYDLLDEGAEPYRKRVG